jgi:hypothetical protein
MLHEHIMGYFLSCRNNLKSVRKITKIRYIYRVNDLLLFNVYNINVLGNFGRTPLPAMPKQYRLSKSSLRLRHGKLELV